VLGPLLSIFANAGFAQAASLLVLDTLGQAAGIGMIIGGALTTKRTMIVPVPIVRGPVSSAAGLSLAGVF
jgi:hypothetical protein